MPGGKQMESYNCKVCSKADDLEMVCCDTCDSWYHFSCVNVTAEIEHVDWHCADCSASSSGKTIGTMKSVSMPPNAEANRQNEQVEQQVYSNAAPGAASLGTPFMAALTSGRHTAPSVSSTKSNELARSRRQCAEAEIIEEELQILRRKEELLSRRKILLSQEEAEDECSNIDPIAVQKWLNATGPTPPASAPPKVPPMCPQTSGVLQSGTPAGHMGPKETFESNIQSQISAMITKLSALEKLVSPQTTPVANASWLPKLLPEKPEQPSCSEMADERVPTLPKPQRCLTKNQLAARTSLGKDLPKFDGKPEEWPLFLATYQQTTEMCDFSDVENLLRLRQALEGAARNSVKNLLLHASCVPQILDTLKMKFGRPELIIAVLLARIREIPVVKENRLDALVDLALEVQNVCATMKASNMLRHLNNPELEQELVNKLPGLLAAFWGMHKLRLPSCNLESLADWLFELAQGANSVLVPSANAKSTVKRGYLNAHASNDTKGSCAVCLGSCDSISECDKFITADRAERWRLIRQHAICRRCLKVHHRLQCASATTCGTDGCSLTHHPLLHNHQSIPASPSNAHHGQSACQYEADSVLFRVLPVTLYNNNKELHTYAFFDDGSSLTLMDAELQEKLQLKGTPQPLCLKWTANTHRYEDDSQVLDLKISGANGKRRFVLQDVHTVKGLELPMQTIDAQQLQTKHTYLQGLPLPSYVDATPKLLIGLNNSRLGVSLRTRERNDNEPVAEKTRLGWTLKGVTGKQKLRTGYHAFHMCDCDTAANTELLRVVKNYVCLDNLEVTPKLTGLISKEDEHAIELLKSTTKRVDGRFETGLLWRHAPTTLPDSLPSALRRAKCLQTKLMREPEHAKILSSKIATYVENGYAKPLPKEALLDKGCWYLPIFPVRNPNKPQKVRIVWDAAAKTKGVSLNSMLLKGPDQITCLVSVLRRFRERAIAISGDIQEMFHQIKIRMQDQDYQRFLWFPPGAMEPSVFVMTVMTFGATCSPSSAQYVKNFNAEDFRSTHSRAVECIVNNHYVDDMLDSVDTEEEAIRLAREVSFVHKQGGFHIRNWRSNSDAVLRGLQANEENDALSLNTGQDMSAEKVLGLWWLTKEDSFTFRIDQQNKHKSLLLDKRCPTKREVLSIVMSIFDPLGFLNFYVIYARIMFQEVWRSGCQWDDKIGDEQYLSWQKWVKLLPKIENLRIPRCYFTNLEGGSELEMHVFVDASENAYAATCYLRHCYKGAVQCTLVGSKAKVAPLKMMSIPRLELQAAVLGVRLAAGILASHTLRIQRQTFWTDSRTVLAWVRSDHRRYSQFVAFRVSEILEFTEMNDWRWIPSAENVADDTTKWHTTPEITSESRWFKGPQFLLREQSHWPIDPVRTQTTDEELKARYVGYHDTTLTNQVHPSIHQRFSRWSRLLRVMATVFLSVRVWKNFRKSNALPQRVVEREDFARAETKLLREAQLDAFGDDIAVLAKGKPVSRKSDIYKLSPYLDEFSVLRLGGRVKLEERPDPVILPKTHNITRLIVLEYHIKYHHGNTETIVNEVRQKFYIPRLRTVVNKVRRECRFCQLRNAQPKPPKMSCLPPTRVAAFVRPFTYVGVDYFGPVLVAVRRSTEKRYGVLFTCLTTRAVHLEIAYSLSADSCILAVRNFMTRRGVPREFWSDNATNFKATQRELTAAFKEMDKDKLVSTFTNSVLQWKFIPPVSPHMGGAWERLIRSVKEILSRVLQSSRPSDEILRGALMEVESIINSRPLTYIPIGSIEEEALTPNHFLLGSSSGMKPLVEPIENPNSSRRGWRYAQQLADEFWKRWLREYLPVITRRTKWFEDVKPIEEGDIVYIVDPNLPRNCWPKGRVISVKIGSDQQVRSAQVKTSAGIYERPATKLAVLSVAASPDMLDPRDIPGGSVAKDTATPQLL